ncbi:MAG: GMC family oxidoreductase [Myxococcota bacterium]|nr:GMC family oxidoreductase [Myxococcota bacterium]
MSSDPPLGTITTPEPRLRYRAVVVGSGPGGSVAASMLARAGRDVLLVEEGPYVPPSACRLYSREEMEQKYRNGGVSLALGNPKVTYVEARCVGGGSEVNAGLFHRLPAEVLEGWRRDFAVEGLEAGDMASHFEATEKALGVAEAEGEAPAAGAKLVEGAARLEFRSVDSPSSFRNGALRDGESRAPERASMTRTLIPDALANGARLLPDTRVRSLRRRGGRWHLRCRHAPYGEGPREVSIEADQVFLSAGAVQTPALLRRSGIKRNVGDSLAMHATAKVTARFADEVNYPGMGVLTQAVDEFAPRFVFTCATSSPAHLALEMIQHPAYYGEVDQHWTRMAVYSARIAGGVGVVRNVPGFSDPLVRFRLSDRDLGDLSEALRTLGAVLFEAGAEVLYPSLIRTEPLRGPGDLERIPRPLARGTTNLMTLHVFSSCPMGENLERCAVDSFGKVHGADDLYVADASLLCTAPTVNPQGSIMALVRRNLLHHLGGL